MGTHGAPSLLKNLDSSLRSGGPYSGDGAHGWTLASIPAQEFGQFLGGVDRTSWADARVAASTHPYSRIWTVLSGGTLTSGTGAQVAFSNHPCSRIRRMDVSGRREVDNLRQRRSRATSSRATRVLSHRRVRLFATFASLSQPGCQPAALRDDDGILLRPCEHSLCHPSLLKNLEVRCVGRLEGNRGWKSTSFCDILLPLLPADWCPRLLRHPTLDARASLLKNLDGGLLLPRATASPG